MKGDDEFFDPKNCHTRIETSMSMPNLMDEDCDSTPKAKNGGMQSRFHEVST
jgi:hypothetical protein